MKTYTVTVHDNGDTFWRMNGKYHRESGPAVEWADGSKYWYKDGKCHRINGPAIEDADGSKAWYIDDKKLTEREFLAATDAKKPSAGCEGKIVVVDGKRYRLVLT